MGGGGMKKLVIAGRLHSTLTVGLLLLIVVVVAASCDDRNQDAHPKRAGNVNAPPQIPGTTHFNEDCYYACMDAIALSPRDLLALCPQCKGSVTTADNYMKCLDREGCTDLFIDICKKKCSW